MKNSDQYWCYINNNEEFEYVKNLSHVKYGNDHIKHFPEFPIIFNLDLRETVYTPFWIFNSDSSFPKFHDLYEELSFEELKAQIFIYQLTM